MWLILVKFQFDTIKLHEHKNKQARMFVELLEKLSSTCVEGNLSTNEDVSSPLISKLFLVLALYIQVMNLNMKIPRMCLPIKIR